MATNSCIAQINNELRDFSVDSLAGHRTMVIVLEKGRTFYLRWALECLVVILILWLSLEYRYFGLISVLLPSFLYFVWIERVRVLDRIDTLGDHFRFRFAYFLFLWMCVGIAEAALKKIF